MKSTILNIVTLCVTFNAHAQENFRAYLKDKKTNEPIVGVVVNILNTDIGNVTDINGLVLLTNINNGKQTISYKIMGYKERYDTLTFPLKNSDTINILLEEEATEIEEVIVSSTRSSRTIQDIPTRVELIGMDELNEKGNMKPGDIRMILSESTGIQTLQTSATSGNSDVRFEGMDGRYTQILKDGFPLYAGFSGGLGLLQTPPLDLKRIEIIKGSSSTLYGGGAIAGLVNLISKIPSKDKELRFILNGTSANGIDISSFYGQRFGKVGITLFGAVDANSPYNPSTTVFAAIPQFKRFTVNPKLFVYPNNKTDITIGANTSFENRLGGDIYYIRGEHDSLHSYYENNKTERISSEFELIHRFDENSTLSIKNCLSHFNRIISAPNYSFDGTQNNTFTEAVFSIHKINFEWTFGGNIFSDGFDELKINSQPSRNYLLTTYGSFMQNTYNISKHFFLETGLRGDYITKYGYALLPRISLLYKMDNNLSSRIGGGLGYKAPTLFTEESEKILYKNILPINPDSNKLEHSYGANWDVNYKTTFQNGKIRLSINQLLFYTRLNSPLVLNSIGNNFYRFENSIDHIDANGAETNIKIGYGYFKLFLGYTYTHSHMHLGNYYFETPLTPRHHTNSVLTYEIEGKWKLGLEAYYYSPQHLNDGTMGRDYWLCGFMAERIWKKCSLFINFENMLDSRQTRFDTIYTGTIENPQFRDIYAPLDGFVINGGLKIKL